MSTRWSNKRLNEFMARVIKISKVYKPNDDKQNIKRFTHTAEESKRMKEDK